MADPFEPILGGLGFDAGKANIDNVGNAIRIPPPAKSADAPFFRILDPNSSFTAGQPSANVGFAHTHVLQENKLPGGDILCGHGGSIELIRYKRAGNSQDVTSQNTESVFLDVYQWQLREEFTDAVFTMSGSVGSKSRRIVSLDWQAKLIIYYDASIVPENFFGIRWADDIGIALYKSWSPLYAGFTSLDKVLTPNHFFQQYRSPSCKLTQVLTTNSEDDIIVQEIIVKANSLIYDINDKEDLDNYISYQNYLIEQKRIISK
jgi:hypothetical protein